MDPEHEQYFRGVQAAAADARKVMARSGFPRECAVGALDDDALRIIAEAAICSWFIAQVDRSLTEAEAKGLLPELAEQPIDWESLPVHWPHYELAAFLQTINKLIIERHLRNPYLWLARLIGSPWPWRGEPS
jgi:hypothetical protein